ncbi:MAG: hypothetical protein QXI93_04230, partial [Candidatus Methanomethylicia archaeon]
HQPPAFGHYGALAPFFGTFEPLRMHKQRARRARCVVAAQRVLDRPSPTQDGWLWASDHVGLLVAVRLGP